MIGARPEVDKECSPSGYRCRMVHQHDCNRRNSSACSSSSRVLILKMRFFRCMRSLNSSCSSWIRSPRRILIPAGDAGSPSIVSIQVVRHPDWSHRRFGTHVEQASFPECSYACRISSTIPGVRQGRSETDVKRGFLSPVSSTACTRSGIYPVPSAVIKGNAVGTAPVCRIRCAGRYDHDHLDIRPFECVDHVLRSWAARRSAPGVFRQG